MTDAQQPTERARRALVDLLRQLDVADAEAAEVNRDKLPSVWQIQNNHIRDYATQIQEALGNE